MLRLLLRLVLLIAASVTPTATAAEPVTPVLKVAPGFSVEPVYVVPRDSQGSWISLCADSRGSLYASDQYGPLYQISLAAEGTVAAQPLKLPIGGVHGMTWIGDELYAVVGQREVCQPGLYRLRDTDSDGRLDSVQQLKTLGGDGEHGPHAVIPAADGQSLFVIAGNASPLPPLARSRVPLWRDDSLLPPLPALIGSETRGLPPGGWICRTDREGRDWELICMGFRNAYAVARNELNELFTFDSDTEFEIGLPWYRPTRLLHCVSGADFGWRRGALKVPENAPDTLPPVLSLGLGSPTAVVFANGAAFPIRYREALLVADWTFGRLLAVHLQPHGASFKAHSEEIVAGTPLPITAACINPKDGALYFITGGRKTQSVLYRLAWQGPDSQSKAEAPASANASIDRRRALERFHGWQEPTALDTAWPFLGDEDLALRHAARIAIESQPVGSWQSRSFAESQPRAALTTLLALTRVGDADAQPKVLEALAAMDWQRLGALRSDWLRVAWLAFSRLGQPPSELRRGWIELLSPCFPTNDPALDGQLCELLVYLQAPDIARKAIAQLTDENTRERQLHFGRCLSTLSAGWTPELRDGYFDWLARASTWHGGASFSAFLQRFRVDALAHAPENERDRLQQRLKIAASSPDERAPDSVPPRPLIKRWTLDELVTLAERSPSAGEAARGRKAFLAARCALCHTFAGEGGAVGMNLTAVARRLSTRELLEAIVNPSKEISDQYGTVVVSRRDGSQVTGRVVNFNGGAIHISTDLFEPSLVIKVPEADVESITRSKVSLMPAGLLDILKADEILDLLAYLKNPSTNR
jgi:putative heme-binding domain-containing protein